MTKKTKKTSSVPPNEIITSDKDTEFPPLGFVPDLKKRATGMQKPSVNSENPSDPLLGDERVSSKDTSEFRGESCHPSSSGLDEMVEEQ